MSTTADAVVIGGGIAGTAVAAELARERRVTLLEMEPALAQHTTGRSAAVWIAGYGGPTVDPFSLASREWYRSRAEGQAGHALLTPRGMLVVAERPADARILEDHIAAGATRVDADDAVAHFPALRPRIVHDAVWDGTVTDIDVMAALQAFRRMLGARGGTVLLSAAVTAIERSGRSWGIITTQGTIVSELVVDAAGAWSDEVAALAGLPPIGLQPMRRTMCTFEAPAGTDGQRWPMLQDAAERFYVKPEGPGFMASPEDETPHEPGDPRPRMEDVAAALEQVRRFTFLEARSIRSSWAGLRTFAPDRGLVLGPDPAAEGFAWCAGGGGFGIMTAPAAAQSVVSLLDHGVLPAAVSAAGGEARHILPDRLRR